MILALLLAAFVPLTPGSYVKARRETSLLRVAALDPQIWTGMPGSGSGGGGVAFPYSSLATFGTADGAAGAVAFNESSGCTTYEGNAADANEFRECVTSLDQDSSITYSVASSIMTVTPAPLDTFWQGIFSVSSDVHVYRHLSMATANDSGFYLGGIDTVPAISFRIVNTPDLPMFITRSDTANSYDLRRHDERDNDLQNGPCGTSACTDPQLIVRDNSTSTTQYQSLGVTGLSGSFRKTLTESLATSIVIIPVAAATGVSGQLLYTVFAKDGTNSQVRSGRIIWSGVAEGTTATCVIGTAEELDNTPTGTLTAAITCTSPANNQIQLLINAVSSLTQTTLEAYGQLLLVGSGEALPQ